MSDDDWGDISQVPSKQRSPLLKFCGIGCVVMLALTMVGGFWIYREIQRSFDPEVQWAELDAFLPHDERPRGWRMEMGWHLGFEMYVLTWRGDVNDGDDEAAAVSELDGADGDVKMAAWIAARDIFGAFEGPSQGWTPAGGEDPITEIEIQGRTLRVSLTSGEDSSFSANWGGEDEEGLTVDEERPALAIDLTPAGAKTPIVLYWLHEDLALLAIEDVRAFLAPFHIGPDR